MRTMERRNMRLERYHNHVDCEGIGSIPRKTLLNRRTMMFHRQFASSFTAALIIFVSTCCSVVSSSCYFPIEFQGTFLIQTKASAAFGGSTVAYSEISIEADAIPPWGRCHLRRGNNVILKDSTGAEDCMRCFHLTRKTPNVIQIHTEGLARCYTTEEAARATCPNDKDVYERRFKEIMLYRKQSPSGTSAIEPVFCPINGRYRFTYTANGGEFRCDQPYSELSNCPQGNGLGVRFRQCSFPDMDVSFLCLGHWDGPNGDKYLALMDLREEPEARPKYRCGLYRVEPMTGKIYVSFALDSTCFAQLNSATNGYESLVLTPLPPRSLPAQVESAHCRFPEWTQGRWEHIHVENNAFIFMDPTTFQTMSSRCIARENTSHNDRFTIYSITQCGEESYNCIWITRRGYNVFEFQLGAESSNKYSDNLCRDQQFAQTNWVTQGSLPGRSSTRASPCPITGDYTGAVPGAIDLCAKVASDCNNPDIMFYTVSSCENRSHVFEEREYRCLGSWEEDGTLYTYTQRRDMPGFQCFAGKVLKNGDEAFIKEAGDSCIRGEDPDVFGMKIIKQASCPHHPAVTFVPMKPNRPQQPTYQLPGVPTSRGTTRDPHWYQAETPTTKPWKPITGRPTTPPGKASGASSCSWFVITSCILVIAVYFFDGSNH